VSRALVVESRERRGGKREKRRTSGWEFVRAWLRNDDGGDDGDGRGIESVVSSTNAFCFSSPALASRGERRECARSCVVGESEKEEAGLTMFERERGVTQKETGKQKEREVCTVVVVVVKEKGKNSHS
jgi:hypothetical protein